MSEDHNDALICQAGVLGYLDNNFTYVLPSVIRASNLDNLNNLFQYQFVLLCMQKNVAFIFESYQVYVLLKHKIFPQFINEVQLEIDKLPADAQFRIKRAMIAIAKERK